MEEEHTCELCDGNFMITMITVNIDVDDDICVRKSAWVCGRCLFLYDNNIKLMIAVNEKKLELEEALEEDGEYDD